MAAPGFSLFFQSTNYWYLLVKKSHHEDHSVVYRGKISHCERQPQALFLLQKETMVY